MYGRRRGWRWGALVGFAVLTALFAYFNAGERVAVNLGVGVLYQVSFVVLVFIVYLLGMLTMYLLGLRHDLKVRRVLREYGLEDAVREAEQPPQAAAHPPDGYP